jgi:hypothetical protein
MIGKVIGTLAAVVFVGAGVVGPGQSAGDGDGQQLAMALADPSPSPILGSTPQPDRALGDDNDGNWSDFTQVPLALVAPLAFAAIMGGSVVFYFLRRARRGTADEAQTTGDDHGHR